MVGASSGAISLEIMIYCLHLQVNSSLSGMRGGSARVILAYLMFTMYHGIRDVGVVLDITRVSAVKQNKRNWTTGSDAESKRFIATSRPSGKHDTIISSIFTSWCLISAMNIHDTDNWRWFLVHSPMTNAQSRYEHPVKCTDPPVCEEDGGTSWFSIVCSMWTVVTAWARYVR